MTIDLNVKFENTYAAELEGLYVLWPGVKVNSPELVILNEDLARQLGFDPAVLVSPEGLDVLVGNESAKGSVTLAQAYAGHQFGHYSPQLGDGRAILLGEVVDRDGVRQDIQLKGSGRTPFSRGGDGKAVLGPMLREYLMGEAMHALNVPTTRALSVVATGESILRQRYEPGAVLARVAASHLRVGTFQFVAVKGDDAILKKLADYAIRRHYPEIFESSSGDENHYLQLLRAVIDKQAATVAKWVSVGFVHGVLNTDNVTISGDTIDYGPCAVIDHYDPEAVFSSIDQHGRYAYHNQPKIMQWNMSRFAETLIPLINPDDHEQAIELATHEIQQFVPKYHAYWIDAMRNKLGLFTPTAGDEELIESLHENLAEQHVDYTQFFRFLANILRGEKIDMSELISCTKNIDKWIESWKQRIGQQSQAGEEIARAMDAVNPLYIARNHKVEEVLDAATAGDMAPFEEMLALLKSPYTKVEGKDSYEQSAPEDAPRHVTFCGT